jgi:hypothetical protein
MKQGRSLVELAQELERQRESKVDYIADTRKLEVVPADDGQRLVVHNGADTALRINELAHRQIGERLGIPAKYYDRMRQEAPELYRHNVNHWFQNDPEKRMVRTLDGTARAFLSNRYQRIDNAHVADVVLPVLLRATELEIASCEVTDAKLYIKAVSRAVRAEIKSKRVGDIVEAGVLISNSEVGLGAVSIKPFLRYLACMNGMVLDKHGLRAAHVGTALDGDEHLAEVLADDTKRAIDNTVLLKVRDVVTAALDQSQLDKTVERIQRLTYEPIKGNPAEAVEVLAQDFGMNGDERTSVLRHLIEGGDLSRYGLLNAVTRTAEDVQSYDRATEIEALGGRLLELPAANWSRIAEAA